MLSRELIQGTGTSLGILLLSTIQAAVPVGASGVEAAASEDPLLLGPVTRQQIEATMPEWVANTVEAAPDSAAAESLVAALPGAEVTVYFGTWCSDSGRELPRLWRALDDLGVLDPPEIRYIGVDRQKTAPAGVEKDANLLLVPTFVVHRGGREVGRVVESAPHGIERDLDDLLSDRTNGLITGSEDPILTEGDH